MLNGRANLIETAAVALVKQKPLQIGKVVRSRHAYRVRRWRIVLLDLFRCKYASPIQIVYVVRVASHLDLYSPFRCCGQNAIKERVKRAALIHDGKFYATSNNRLVSVFVIACVG